MKYLFYYLSLLLLLLFTTTSCDKEDRYTVVPDELSGRWQLEKFVSYSIDTSDKSLKDKISKHIEEYSCGRDWYEFIINKSSDRPLRMERSSCRRGILGCEFIIDGDKLIDAARQIEAFDLRIMQDTLYVSIDETMGYNRDFKTNLVKNVTIKNKYIRSK